MSAIVLWLIGSLLLAISAWMSFLNARVFWKRHVLKTQSPSWVPFLGGACGAAALALLPVKEFHSWWWVPLLLDWGSVPGMVYSIIWLIGRGIRARK